MRANPDCLMCDGSGLATPKRLGWDCPYCHDSLWIERFNMLRAEQECATDADRNLQEARRG